MVSKKFSLNKEDLVKVIKNGLMFIAPDLIVFLGALSLKFSAEGAIVIVLALNLVIDLLKKYLAGK